MLIDTDVLIWNLRGNAKAAERLGHAGGFVLSAVSYMELIQPRKSSCPLRHAARRLSWLKGCSKSRCTLRVNGATAARARPARRPAALQLLGIE